MNEAITIAALFFIFLLLRRAIKQSLFTAKKRKIIQEELLDIVSNPKYKVRGKYE